MKDTYRYLQVICLMAVCHGRATAQSARGCGQPDDRSIGLLTRAVNDARYEQMRQRFGIATIVLAHTHRLVDETSRGKCARITELLSAWPHKKAHTELRFYEIDGFFLVTAINDESLAGGKGFTTRIAVLKDDRLIGIMQTE